MSEKEKKVTIHNSSVIMARNEDKVQSTVSRANKLKSIVSSLPFDWLTYEELSRLYYSVQIRSVSVLSPVAVALLGGQCLSYEHSSLKLKSGRDRQGLIFRTCFYFFKVPYWDYCVDQFLRVLTQFAKISPRKKLYFYLSLFDYNFLFSIKRIFYFNIF